MKVKMADFEDDLFVGLSVATYFDKGGDLKKELGYKRGKGFTKVEVCNEIRAKYADFLNFRIDKEYYQRLELFFEVNFAVVTLIGKSKVTFLYHSTNWKNIHFFYSRSDSIDYIKPDIKFLFPKLSKKHCLIGLSISDIFEIFKKPLPKVTFTLKNLHIFEAALEKHIEIFEHPKNQKINFVEDRVSPFYDTIYSEVVRFTIKDSELVDTPKADFVFLANNKLIVHEYSCTKTKGCFYSNERKKEVDIHEKSCSDEQVIVTKQRAFGDGETLLEFGVREGYVPLEYCDFQQYFFCVFDIETLESRVDGEKIGSSTTIESRQKIVSIAIASNLPNTEPIFLYRKSSEPEAEQELLDNFLSELDKIYSIYKANLPTFIEDSIEQLNNDIGPESFSKSRTKKTLLRNHLKTYQRLPVFAFNGGKCISIFL